MTTLSSHILDTTLGKPAPSIQIHMTNASGQVYQGITDADGRCKTWLGESGERVSDLGAGEYHLRFLIKDYLVEHHGKSFYPYVDISFLVEDGIAHYHVPLLVSPFGFSTYRGS